jgi:protein TonB
MSSHPRQSATAPPGGHVLAYALVAAAHVGGLALFGLQAAPERIGGAAPMVNLTLTPSPRFDSPTPPAAASKAERQAGGAARPQAADRLRAHLTPNVFPTDLTAPPPIQPQPSEQARRPDDSRTDAPGPPGQGQAGERGRVDVDESVAGATQGGGGASLGAAAAADTDTYAAEVLAWIERHKRHPGGARGVVTVSFELDRRGRVHRLRLARSSGIRALDRSALDQIAATQPFPRPAPGARWSLRDFTVNIDYRARGAA